jgi:hypothetical protein
MIALSIAAAVLILDAWAILDIFTGGKDLERKALWIALILFLPLAGPLFYLLLSGRGTSAAKIG